jgi:hypothetical protein
MGEVIDRVRAIQASMTEEAKSCFDEEELGDLRCVIRLTVEFQDYLEHGSTEIALRLQQGPMAHLFNNLQIAAADPFNKYDLQYACDSVRSGVDSFCRLNQAYRVLIGATGTRFQWNTLVSADSFKRRFISMFDEFIVEKNFESKCRLLLDLFKLQMVFAAVSYDH